ncbi:MAG: aryl-sulfate sulfotransferase, partial [Candidatus Altiarchaeota archaeon]|nr:aryl-sulfate sulfotransferase [Candidatus Altiarchaeota archaeon]
MRKLVFVILFVLVSTACLEKETEKGDTVVNRLVDLGYLSETDIAEEDIGKANVLSYKNTSYSGLTMYCNMDIDIAYLMDMKGDIIHVISAGQGGGCTLAEPIDENSFLFLIKETALVKVDWESNIIWKINDIFHHDMTIGENATIYALTQAKINNSLVSPGKEITEDYITTITPDGKIVSKLSFSELYSKNPELLKMVEGAEADVYHVNNVEYIPQDIVYSENLTFKKGNILVSVRNTDTIGVVDLQKREMIWYWGPGTLNHQHNPSMTPDNNILVFDNNPERGYSSIVEVNPATEEVVWEYFGDPPKSFYSEKMGSTQRLENGNTLITESYKGHVFEINHKKEIVWDFWDPHINHGKRKTMYRATRLPKGFKGINVEYTGDTTPVKPNILEVCSMLKRQ